MTIYRFSLSLWISRLIGASLVAALILPALALAEGGFGDREQRRQQLIQDLGLSEQQASQLDSIREKNRAQADSLRQQIMQKRQAMMQYASASNADPARARAMQQEINELHGRLSELKMNTWFQMRQSLSPEQLQKLEQMRQKARPDGREGGFKPGGGGGGGAWQHSRPGHPHPRMRPGGDHYGPQGGMHRSPGPVD